ncbi:lipopolysaccharide export system protein LptA [Shewanella carassii]|uniref:lipopolysaccharide transport periplasmic protein LptA n=1 Tax=Shewanella carassii TaxID=1987584 RepID=UPI001BEED853|nr:lipopolysaccharide transport periplasmic protein LptA [Shewanella carassii]BCV65315.1 lipopolysaccharide export system protein LptA [Shewanella carassii]
MKPSKFFIGALLCITSLSAIAIEEDLLQKVEISAANQFADIKNKRVVYGGPVTVTQGSLKLLADELTAYTEDKSGERILVAKGSPATYTQKLEDGRLASAKAKEIHYNIDSRIMTLIGQAKVEQDGSEVTAEKIVYDINKQQLEAESSGKGQDRVTTVIQPENYQDLNKKEQQQEPQ